jgi:hypothetical protein
VLLLLLLLTWLLLSCIAAIVVVVAAVSVIVDITLSTLLAYFSCSLAANQKDLTKTRQGCIAHGMGMERSPLDWPYQGRRHS